MQNAPRFNAESSKLANEIKILKDEKKRIRVPMKMTDVIRLNVGGEQMMTTRASLSTAPKSALTYLFNSRWEEKLYRDIDGNIFLDFNPPLFRHLLQQLRTVKRVGPLGGFSPPPSSSPSTIQSFNKMLKQLGLHPDLKPPNKVIVMNVGGNRMMTREKTLNEANSTALISRPAKAVRQDGVKHNSLFVDADPQAFSSFIGNLRLSQATNAMCSSPSSSSNRLRVFNRMLKNFKLTGETRE